jgi:hypothetical protein
VKNRTTRVLPSTFDLNRIAPSRDARECGHMTISTSNWGSSCDSDLRGSYVSCQSRSDVQASLRTLRATALLAESGSTSSARLSGAADPGRLSVAPGGSSARERPNDRSQAVIALRESPTWTRTLPLDYPWHYQALTAFYLATVLSLLLLVNGVKTCSLRVGNVRAGNTRLLACVSRRAVLCAQIRPLKRLAQPAGSSPGRARLVIFTFMDSPRDGSNAGRGGNRPARSTRRLCATSI